MKRDLLLSLVLLVSFGSWGVGCGSREATVLKEQHETCLKEKTAIEAQLAVINRTLTEKDRQLGELNGRVADLEQNKAGLEAEIATLADNLSLYRSDARSSKTRIIEGGMSDLEAEYAKLVDISIVDCRYLRKHTVNRQPGIQFKVNNRGARTVNKLTVTVSFIGKDKKMVAEDTLVLVDSEPVQTVNPEGGEPPQPINLLPTALKPNFTVRVPVDESQYLPAKQVSSDWDEGKIEVSISALGLVSLR